MDKLTEFTDAGAVTQDPVFAAGFLGKNIGDDFGLVSVSCDGATPFLIRYANGDEAEYWDITIPYRLIREWYQPVKGEPIIADSTAMGLDDELVVWWKFNAVCRALGRVRRPKWTYYHKRVLIVIDTRAELRGLAARCEAVK